MIWLHHISESGYNIYEVEYITKGFLLSYMNCGYKEYC